MLKKITPQKKSMIYFVLASVSLLPLGIAVSAQQQQNGSQNINGNNVTQVDFPVDSHIETIALTSSGEWIQYGAQNEIRFRFVELGRDITSVYLNDVSRNFQIRLDVSDSTLSFQDENGQKAVFGRMTAMSAQPVVIQQQTRNVPNRQQQTPNFQNQQPNTPPPSRPSFSAPPPQDANNPFANNGNGGQSAPPAQGGFNPFANNGGQTSQSADARPNTPPPSTASQPPWARQTTNNAATTNAPQKPEIPAVAKEPPYGGIWVQRNIRRESTGDGLSGPVLWSEPEIINIVRNGPSGMTIYYENQPVATTKLRKVSENKFTNQRFTATFSQEGDSSFLSLRGPGYNREYTVSRTASGVLTKNRFDNTDKDSRRGLFNGDGLARSWNYNLHSYDAAEMDLFNFARGRRLQIFKQPGDYDHAKDDNFSIALPYGLRGEHIKTASASRTEAMITNEASFQKGMSYNYGGNAGIPGKGSAGVKYSREKTSGAKRSQGQTNSIGMVRIERYALIIDKPNIQLSDGFRRDVRKLATGNLSPSNFRKTYGTHYARAITYGGLGKAERSMTSQEMSKFMSDKYSSSTNGSFKGVGVDGGFSETKSSKQSSTSLFTSSSFEAVGGSGSSTIEGWTVADNDTIPVRYDLRPLSELISPLFFLDEYNSQKMSSYNSARVKLLNEIKNYMNSFPAPSNVNFGPAIYQIDVKSLACKSKGDEGDNNVEIFGKLSFKYIDDGGFRVIPLFEDNDSTDFVCGGRAKGINKKAIAIVSKNGPNSSASNHGTFHMDAKLIEDDNSVTDKNDPIFYINQTVKTRQFANHASSRQQTETFGIPYVDPPILTLRYTIRKLE